jgi:hypothetical protein
LLSLSIFLFCVRRQVDMSTGIISTVPTGVLFFIDIDIDTRGNLYGVGDIHVYQLDYPFDETAAWRVIAGTPSFAGFSGDGGLATSAQLMYPQGIAVDVSANVYIADYFNYRVRLVTKSTGIITTIAGNSNYGDEGDGGPATSASILPQSVAVDSTRGILYIFGNYNWKIRAVQLSTGIITTVVGTGAYGSSGDGGPASSATLEYLHQLVVDSRGNLFITSVSGCAIRYVQYSTGIITTIAGRSDLCGSMGDGGPATLAQLFNPRGIAVDEANNRLFIADTSNDVVRTVAMYFPPPVPSSQPTSDPTKYAIGPKNPSSQPSVQPTMQPSRQPSSMPSKQAIGLSNTVTYNGNLYATLANEVVEGTCGGSCQSSFIELPAGWSIAPDTPDSVAVIAAHTWNTHVVAVAGGNSYGGLCYSKGLWNANMLVQSGNTYRAAGCSLQVLIVRPISTDPTTKPTPRPSGQPTNQPSKQPSQPSGLPTSDPTKYAIGPKNPSGQPTGSPSCQPSRQPSALPTAFTTRAPTVAPSVFAAGIINRFAGMYGSAVDSGDGGQAKSASLWWPEAVCVDSVHHTVYIMTSYTIR